MRRYYGIEFLRLLSSLSVLLYHYRHFFSPYTTYSSNDFNDSKMNLPFYISSVVHKFAFFNINDLNMSGFYNGWVAYFNTKLMVLLFTYKLNLIFKDTQSFAIHPGWIKTNFGNNNLNTIRKLLSHARSTFAKNPEIVAKRIFKLLMRNDLSKKNCYYCIEKISKSSSKSQK